jgi:hypothetical protein
MDKFLQIMMEQVRKDGPTTCPDCGAVPGSPHEEGCDVERCSVCGRQRLGDDCEGHDKYFSRWTGFWPGSLECIALGMDLNALEMSDYPRLFFVKPKMEAGE